MDADNEKKSGKGREKVRHNYHDHANDVSDGADGNVNEETNPEGDDKAKDQQQSFPAKLHYMLNEMEKDGMDHIVSWQPHGRSFVVHNHHLFVRNILSRYVHFLFTDRNPEVLTVF